MSASDATRRGRRTGSTPRRAAGPRARAARGARVHRPRARPRVRAPATPEPLAGRGASRGRRSTAAFRPSSSVLARHEGYQILHSLIEWPTNRISSTVDALRTPSVLAFAAGGARGVARRAPPVRRTHRSARRACCSRSTASRSSTRKRRAATCSPRRCARTRARCSRSYVLAPRRWSRVGWIVCSALAIYAHGFAVLAIVAQVAALWFLPAARRRELHWIRDGILIALLRRARDPRARVADQQRRDRLHLEAGPQRGARASSGRWRAAP